jgi:hypothetical protein
MNVYYKPARPIFIHEYKILIWFRQQLVTVLGHFKMFDQFVICPHGVTIG